MGKILRWPKASGKLRSSPLRLDKAADYGLYNSVHQMELQWGTVEAHNRLAEWCARLRAKVESGRASQPNPAVANEFRPTLRGRLT